MAGGRARGGEGEERRFLRKTRVDLLRAAIAIRRTPRSTGTVSKNKIPRIPDEIATPAGCNTPYAG